MSKYDLSILIPARNEEFLSRTVQDICTNKEGKTEVIVVLDGEWANPPLIQHPDVTVVYLPESIGQRAATNLACRLSKAKYVMKVDAHCAFDKGFDVKLMADMQDDMTVVPIMRNLHAFDWVCEDGHRRYQGPSGPCKECGKPTTKDVVWIAKKSPQSTAYCFDSEPHFQYFHDLKNRQKGDLVETMSLQGSCFMLTREKYWQLNICDEEFGSWGSQGIEVAVKTWLSGGRVIVNKKTWYAHLFRTQGGDFGFPYPLSGNQVSSAKKLAKKVFFEGAFEGQIYPMSWLLEKFWPVPGWTQEQLDNLKIVGADLINKSVSFSGPQSITPLTPSLSSIDVRRENVPVSTVGHTRLSGAGADTSENVDLVADQSKVSGVTAKSVVADVVNDRSIFTESTGEGANHPRVNNSMDSNLGAAKADATISEVVRVASPEPACLGDINLSEKSVDKLGGDVLRVNHCPQIVSNGVSKSIIYYTDNRLNIKLAKKVREQLKKTNLPIVSASLKPMDFGKNIHIKEPRGHLTMFKQILAALEASDAEVVFFCEHDVMYHPSHFKFTPPKKDIYYYNVNVWKTDGKKAFKVDDCRQVSGLVAYRDLLIKHYRERIRRVEESGHSVKMGFEPGTHNREERIDDYKSETYMSEKPNVDIRHDNNLTPTRWSPEEFRDQRYTKGWIEGDGEELLKEFNQ